MFFVAAVLTILSGLFYAAGRHEIGSLGVAMCQQPVLRQSVSRAGRCGVGRVLGRIRQRALTSAFGSPQTSVKMPLCR